MADPFDITQLFISIILSAAAFTRRKSRSTWKKIKIKIYIDSLLARGK